MNKLSESTELIASNTHKKFKTAVFIGRFQPLHSAHLRIISEALKIADNLIISIGSAHRPKTIKNPWTSSERETMIKKTVARYLDKNEAWSDKPDPYESKIKYIHVRDHMYNNTKWATELYSKACLAGASQDKDTVLIGCFKDDSSFYLNMFPQWSFHRIGLIKENGHPLNSTDVRHLLFGDNLDIRYIWQIPGSISDYLENDWMKQPIAKELQEEYDFLCKYKKEWESAPYPPTFVTVDAVVVKSGHVLVIRRKFNPGKGLLALPGGFINANESIEKSCIRELKEETKIDIPKPILKRSIKEVKVFDHPNRSERGRTITHAHLIDLGEGPLPSIKANDDASGAYWVPIADLYRQEEFLYEDHGDIIQNLISRF